MCGTVAPMGDVLPRRFRRYPLHPFWALANIVSREEAVLAFSFAARVCVCVWMSVWGAAAGQFEGPQAPPRWSAFGPARLCPPPRLSHEVPPPQRERGTCLIRCDSGCAPRALEFGEKSAAPFRNSATRAISTSAAYPYLAQQTFKTYWAQAWTYYCPAFGGAVVISAGLPNNLPICCLHARRNAAGGGTTPPRNVGRVWNAFLPHATCCRISRSHPRIGQPCSQPC